MVSVNKPRKDASLGHATAFDRTCSSESRPVRSFLQITESEVVLLDFILTSPHLNLPKCSGSPCV